MSDAVIVADSVVKRFGAVEAVRGISFAIARGSCVGLLGPNGAGKTTTMRLITCLSPLTSGRLNVFGLDVEGAPKAIKQRVGVVPQETHLHREFSVEENVYYYSRYFGLSRHDAWQRVDEVLDLVGMSLRRNDATPPLSGGLKRRVAIARGLVNRPELLMLDEPTTGLDPQARHALWKIIRDLQRRGVTIVLTTHMMDEAASLCDRVIVVDQGNILADGRPQALVESRLGMECVEIEVESAGLRELDRIVTHHALARHEGEDGRIYLYAASAEAVLPVLARLPHRHLVHRRSTLEDVFLALTGRGLS